MRENGKTCVIKIEVIERTPKVSLAFFFGFQIVVCNLLERFQKVTEKSGMMVTIQSRSIINVYLRPSTKIIQDNVSLCLLNFCLKNSCDQMHLRLYKPNYIIFHSYVTFYLTIAS